jgi:hypothetical protein
VSYDWKTDFPGVFSVHADECPVRDGGEERCGPAGYRASVRDWTTNRRIVGPMFGSLQEALAWQRDQLASHERARGVHERTELGALIDDYIQATEDQPLPGSGDPAFTREQVRALRGALSYVDSELGTMAVQDVRRRHIQAMIDQLRGSGLAEDRVGEVVEALRSLYAYAIRRELVGFSPVVELDSPPVATAATNGKTRYTHLSAPAAAWTTSDIPAVAAPLGTIPFTPPPFSPPDQTPGAVHLPPEPEPPPPAQPPPPQPTPPPPAPASALPPQPPSPPPPPQPPPQTPPPPTTQVFPPQTYTWPQQPPTTPPPLHTPDSPYAPYPPPRPTGPMSAIFGASAPTAADADYDSTMQERWLWWTVRLIVIVFVLIALVLVAESV